MKKIISLLLLLSLTFTAVPQTAAAAPPAARGGPAGQAAGEVYDLNTVGYDDLVAIKGIGPVLAERIIDHRTARGSFTSIEELLEVKGIGEKSFAKLRVHFTLSPPPSPVATSSSP